MEDATNFGQDGNLLGYTSYFDGVSTADFWADLNPETDEQGRLSRIVREGSYTLDYIYAEDGLSYKMVYNYADGKTFEREIQLSERQIPEIVALRPEEMRPGSYEYNGDGWPVRADYTFKNIDGNEVSETLGYSYRCELFENGALRGLMQTEKGSGTSYERCVLGFDRQGRLISYGVYYGRMYSFRYDYE